jgi:GT2 family glycosyltransferase
MAQKMTYPKVSIVIVNWNGLEDTIECLESLKKVGYPNYEVIVVDNGSTGNDAQVLREKFGDYIHLIANEKNYGFAGGLNIGMRYALANSASAYILLLNNDIVVAPDFLHQLISFAEADTSLGIIGPKNYCYNSPNLIDSMGANMNMWTGKGKCLGYRHADTGKFDVPLEVDWLGPCVLLKAEVIQKIGFYDESYFCYCEDIDYCIRVKKAGYKVMTVPQAKIWHKGGHSTQKMTGLISYYAGRNRFRFMKKHATPWQYRFFLIYFFCVHFWLATGYYLVFHRSLKQVINFYRGVRDGLRGIAGAKI